MKCNNFFFQIARMTYIINESLKEEDYYNKSELVKQSDDEIRQDEGESYEDITSEISDSETKEDITSEAIKQ